MSLSIRTNISSLNAQRNLSVNQVGLDSSLSRLSSGFRITKAGDDAAGLGISTKLESQIRSYTQATRNANDGLSVVQSTEAALNEQANVLTRMRELAMQSASDGVGNVERGYIEKESSKLLAELQRISQVAEYNGTKLLDGSAASLDFQVGIAATSNDVISLTTLNGTTAAAGAGGPAGVGATSPSTGVFQPWFAAAVSGFTTSFTSSTSRDVAALAGEAQAQLAGASPTQAFDAASLVSSVLGYYYDLVNDGGFATNNMPPGAHLTAALSLASSLSGGGSGGDPVLAGALQSYATTYATSGNTTAAWNAAEATGVTLGAAAGASIPSNVGIWTAQIADVLFGAVAGVSGGLGVPAGDAAGLQALGFAATGATTSGGLGVAGLSMTTKASALAALASIDSALATISSNRATLGAAGNRFQSAISNIQSFSESLSAANSRIKDVDVAEETSRMSRSQILLQAGVSVLAQANQMPQMALKLLG